MSIQVEIEITRSKGPSWAVQLIQELQDYGINLERIAEEMGISVRMVCYLKATGAEPRYTPGDRLKAFHAKVFQNSGKPLHGLTEKQDPP